MESNLRGEIEQIIKYEFQALYNERVLPLVREFNEFKEETENTLYDRDKGHVRLIDRHGLIQVIIAVATVINMIATIGIFIVLAVILAQG